MGCLKGGMEGRLDFEKLKGVWEEGGAVGSILMEVDGVSENTTLWEDGGTAGSVSLKFEGCFF